MVPLKFVRLIVTNLECETSQNTAHHTHVFSPGRGVAHLLTEVTKKRVMLLGSYQCLTRECFYSATVFSIVF